MKERTIRVIIAEKDISVEIEAGSDCDVYTDVSRSILEALGVGLANISDDSHTRPPTPDATRTKIRGAK